MRIIRLQLSSFRNLGELLWEPDGQFNIISGDNAQGKTNLIESVYLLATLKSFRTQRNRELVAWGESQATAATIVERREVVRRYSIQIDKESGGRRVAEVDGKRIKRLTEYFGGFNVLLFTPDELVVSKGEPSKRRRYLDRAVFNQSPGYLETLRAYEEALLNRNALLRELQQRGSANASVRAMLEAFDEPVARLASKVIVRRLNYLADIAADFQEAHAAITDSGQSVELRYRCSLLRKEIVVGEETFETNEDAVMECARERLEESLEMDMARGFSGVGPHTDDLLSLMDGRGLRRYGSQGQHRTLLLALKLAEMVHLERKLDFVPILLLDDVSSELDQGRGRRFLERVEQAGGQVFVTTTDPALVKPDGRYARWEIENGSVRRLKSGGKS